MASNHRFRVAIDIGSEGSSVAWIVTSSPEEVKTVMEWPGTNLSSFFVRNAISYDDAGKIQKWGYEVKPGDKRVDHLELMLWSLSTTGGIQPFIVHNKRPTDIITDYLSCLRKHIMNSLAGHFGSAFIAATPVNWIFLIPALTTDNQRGSLVQIAESAGYGQTPPLQLVGRLEAALVWGLMRDIEPCPLQVNDVLVALDWGSIHCDLQSFKVMALKPTLVLKKCTPAIRAHCSSSLMTHKFGQFAQTRLGVKLRVQVKVRIQKEFNELELPLFANTDGTAIYCFSVPGISDSVAAGVKDRIWTVTHEEMKSIVVPPIDELISLVRQQILSVERKGLIVSAVLCIGGGEPYRYLVERFDVLEVEILQLQERWTAAVRGATLGIRLVNPTAKINYGVRCDGAFVFGKDPPKNLSYCPYTGEARTKNRIHWFIKQGDEMKNDSVFTVALSHRIGPDDDMVFTNTLFTWDQTLPEYSNQVPNIIETLCQLEINFGAVPKEQLASEYGPTVAPYLEIKYELVVTILSETIRFQIMFQEKEYASWSTEIEV